MTAASVDPAAPGGVPVERSRAGSRRPAVAQHTWKRPLDDSRPFDHSYGSLQARRWMEAAIEAATAAFGAYLAWSGLRERSPDLSPATGVDQVLEIIRAALSLAGKRTIDHLHDRDIRRTATV